MNKLKPWLFLSVIFLAGAIAGSALTLGLGSRFMHPNPPGPQQMKKLWLVHLTHRLNLTPDQQAKIEPILAGAEPKLATVHRDEVDRASKIIEETSRQLATILTPEQQAEMAKMEKEMNQDRDRMFPGGHHGGWGPGGGPGGKDHPPRDGSGSQPSPPRDAAGTKDQPSTPTTSNIGKP